MTCQSVNGKCVKKAKSCGEGKIEDESAKCADKSKKCCVEGKKGKKKISASGKKGQIFKNLNVETSKMPYHPILTFCKR